MFDDPAHAVLHEKEDAFPEQEVNCYYEVHVALLDSEVSAPHGPRVCTTLHGLPLALRRVDRACEIEDIIGCFVPKTLFSSCGRE